MSFVRVSKKYLNLRYLIMAEEWDGTPDTVDLVPGGVRVTMETGRVFCVPPADAAYLLCRLEQEVPGHDAGGLGGPVIGRPSGEDDPCEGEKPSGNPVGPG